MCVAAIAWQAHPEWPLVIAANRDEYQKRPTASLSRWHNGTIAGRDLQAGGTWLGLVEAGRLALVTNFRVPGYPRPELASRGALVTGWLRGQPLPDVATMNPFNLLLVDQSHARVLTNHPQPEEHSLSPGVHGLSNGAFTRPWPKAGQLCADLAGWLEQGTGDLSPLFAALRSEATFPAEDGGDGPEQAYSGVFIRNETYGTRCSTVVAVDRKGQGMIIERRCEPTGQETGETTLNFVWPLAT
jgi:uncharacterized protein with NRDE domain